MINTPQIHFPDGSGTTTQLSLTTNSQNLYLTGQVSTDTVDLQVNINDSGWVANPTLVSLSGTSFSIPNTSSMPNGVELNYGSNSIQIRAISLTGSVSAPAQVQVIVNNSLEFENQQSPPTGLILRRRANSVELLWSDVSVQEARGFNIYASTGEGGTGSGYLRINKSLIPISSPTEVLTETFEVGSSEYKFSDSEDLDLQIQITTVEPTDGSRVEQKVLNQYPLISSPNYKVGFQVFGEESTRRFMYSHDRYSNDEEVLNNDIFGVLSPSDNIYYVVTAVYFDPDAGKLVESRFSNELAGSPLILDTTIRGIPIRESAQVTEDYINQIQKKEPTLSLIPGSTVREIHIEPFSNEVQKVYFLQDFIHRSKSFAALIAIDDPGYTGTSVPVSNSSYKQNLRTALSTADDTAVQALINSSFDSLAENYGELREGRKPATVVQTFYTKTRPLQNKIVAQGAVVSASSIPGAPRFVSRGQTTMYAASADSYYNNETKFYEIKVQMIAESSGSSGNVPAGALDTVISGANGFFTKNDVRAENGRESEGNLSLAERCMSKLSSLDTGTIGGYEKTAISVAGLHNVKIVRSGSPLMMRDYDEIRGKHIGGKVDVWVKGAIERTVQEVFAFQFNIARRIRFDVVSAENLIFRARDSRLSVSNPIQEMMFDGENGLGLFNLSVTPTGSYDGTGVKILDYNTIQISSGFVQPETNLDDFIEGDYRYRSNNQFVPSIQPVRRVVSVVGQQSGSLDGTSGYNLYKLQDPLLEGESTRASDFISINQVGGVPNGQPRQINDELHVLIGSFEEKLDSVGINNYSVRVYSADRTVLYNGPDTQDPDYLIIAGTQSSASRIVRSPNSSIISGSTISVDYEHDENFVITYVVNDILQSLQRKINDSSHATADVLVKQFVENPMHLESTIQLEKNADQSTTDSSIRTAISILTASQSVRGSIHQSDMVGVIEGSSGVDYVVQPFTRMSLQDGALRIRDPLSNDHSMIVSLSSGLNAVYILNSSLPFSTVDGGTDGVSHFGVYKDTIRMEASNSIGTMSESPNQFYIIGGFGGVISGFSDDATLISEGYQASELATARKQKTANKVLISLPVGTSPSEFTFHATYSVFNDKSTGDLITTDVEYLTPGNIVLTYKKAV